MDRKTWWISCANSDGEPGPQVLWRGFQHLLYIEQRAAARAEDAVMQGFFPARFAHEQDALVARRQLFISASHRHFGHEGSPVPAIS